MVKRGSISPPENLPLFGDLEPEQPKSPDNPPQQDLQAAYEKELQEYRTLLNQECRSCGTTLGTCHACESKKVRLRQLAKSLNISVDIP